MKVFTNESLSSLVRKQILSGKGLRNAEEFTTKQLFKIERHLEELYPYGIDLNYLNDYFEYEYYEIIDWLNDGEPF